MLELVNTSGFSVTKENRILDSGCAAGRPARVGFPAGPQLEVNLSRFRATSNQRMLRGSPLISTFSTGYGQGDAGSCCCLSKPDETARRSHPAPGLYAALPSASTNMETSVHFGIMSDARVILGCSSLALFYKPGDLGLYELREVAIL